MDFTNWMVGKVAKEAKLDISKYNIDQLVLGFRKEIAEGKEPKGVLKLVIGRLEDDPEYYSKLKKMMGDRVLKADDKLI